MNATMNKTNTGKLVAIFAVVLMAVCAFTLIPSESSEAAPSDTQSYSGILDGDNVEQTFPANTNVVINDTLTITNGAKMYVGGDLTVNTGVEIIISNGGELYIGKANGETETPIVDCLVTINGEITITGEDSVMTVYNDTSSDYDETGVIVNGTVTVTRGGSLVGEVSSTGQSNDVDASVLINNNANLNVTSSGSRISNISGLNVDVAAGGTFRFDGRAGETGSEMKVTSYGTETGCVTSTVTITAGTPGENNNSTSDLTFTTTRSTYTGYVDADNTTPIRDYALNVTGTVDGDDEISFDSNYEDTTYTSKDAAEASNHTYNDLVVGKVIIDSLNVRVGSSIVLNQGSYVVVQNSLNVAYDADVSATKENVINGTIELIGTFTGDLDSLNTTQMTNQDGTLVINGGSATFKHYTATFAGATSIYGAMWIDDDEDNTVYISSLATAITDAVTAGIDEVSVIGLNGSWADADGRGSYVLDSDLELPDNMNLNIICGLLINEGVTMTIPDGASVELGLPGSGIHVNGKIVDYDTISESDALAYINFEVMSTVETETDIINTYTSFATALSETTSGTIYLYDDIVIDRNMTIPADVTVQFADNPKDATASISFEDDTNYTFTINGTVYLSTGHTFDVGGGSVVVNNILKTQDATGTAIANNTGDHLVDGAYFAATLGDDTGEYNYITSVAFAAENSADIDAESGENTITITGNVAMGDVAFTLGEEVDDLTVAISNTGTDRANGNVTLVGAVTFDSSEGTFTGTVTDGTTAIEMDMSSGAIVGFDIEETVDSSIVRMTLGGDSDGIITINAGTVYAVNNASYQKIIIASEATMVVPEEVSVGFTSPYLEEILKYITETDDDAAQREAIRTLFNALGIDNNLPLYTSERMETLSGLVVEGTLTVEGSVTAFVSTINGTVTTSGDVSELYLLLSEINGAVTVDENSSAGFILAIVNGSMSGEFSAVDFLTSDSVAMIAYPGSDITGAVINDDNGDGASDLDSTTIYVNGDVYATMYAMQNINISSATLGIGLNGIPLKSILLFTDIPGYDENTAVFYMDEAMANPINNMSGSTVATAYSNLIDAMRNASGGLAALQAFVESLDGAYVGDYQNVYIEMDPSQITGTITTYDRLSVYIDGLSLENLREGNNYVLDVGQHTISVQIAPGYTGTYEITLNGQVITGNTFEITGDMKEFQIVVSGNITQESIVVDGGNGGNDELGLTDYLLIILVVLIVVMAIIVAMRLMRS